MACFDSAGGQTATYGGERKDRRARLADRRAGRPAARRSEPLAYGIRRVAVGRLESAVERLRDPDADEVEAVHGARKDMKKLRSLDQRFSDEAPPGGWGGIRAALSAAGSGNGDVDVAALRERVAEEIEAGRRRLENLGLPGKGFEVVEPGLRRAYSRGRARLREAAEEPSDERLHEWRKRAKDLWYHLRLLRPGWRPVLEPLADQAHELSDLLGDDHDLVVLSEHLDDPGVALSGEQRVHLGGLIGRRRGELQQHAFALGERLYAENPKAYAKRLGRYWEAERV